MRASLAHCSNSSSALTLTRIIETIQLFVYYPMFETVLFSGVLGCGSIPVLGGRPYEMKKEAKAQLKMQSSAACPSDMT